MNNEQTRLHAAPWRTLLSQVSLAVICGGLLILGYPPFGFWPCVILAWAGLFVLVLNSSVRTSFYLGLLFGFLGYGGSLLWFKNIFGIAAIPLYGILAIFVMLSGMSACYFSRRFKSPWLKALLIASLFAGFEFFRCELFFLKFPWISAGSALPPNWLTPIVGVYGCSFLIFAATAFLTVRGTRVAGSGLLILLIGICIFRPPSVMPVGPGTIRVAVVQGEELSFNEYVNLTKKTLDQAPMLIAWPEYALPYDVRKKEPRQLDELRDLAKAHDAIFVIGTKTTMGKGEREWWNTALTIGGDGVLGEHHKNRPVHFFNDGIAGTSADPVRTPIGLVGTEICFDCDYESITRELVRKGAELIVIPTFDAEEWGEIQHRQHSVFFQLRAAENGRWLICSASSGSSKIVDPHGHVHESLPFARTDAFTGKIVPLAGRTIYNRIGWLFPWSVMLAAIVLCISAVAGRKGKPGIESVIDI
ncbi:MAG: hypothetical protein A2X48_02585 [Lentisphaerae bacterium GWF2_49_21]|nr:MAG: hypothetical protein A2X48_02585 [Lentisphaerae bacterium GWF2_49_21]